MVQVRTLSLLGDTDVVFTDLVDIGLDKDGLVVLVESCHSIGNDRLHVEKRLDG